uniref:Unique cartilage matrix-associated protein n=1 Tax=Erpetoichthys calabaricus TaxID=27687 RepID=A0A8C4X8W5_ERPCA
MYSNVLHYCKQINMRCRIFRSLEMPKTSENRQRLAADERRREYYEEQRNEYENYVEEERDEQYERTREKTEQWREWHYDGLYPPYEYNRHHV